MQIKLHITYTLSWLLIPVFAFLYYKYDFARSILFNSMICVALIGTLNTVRERQEKQQQQYWQYYLTLIFHLGFLVILRDYKKYGGINKWSLLLLLAAILITYYLPWWPYFSATRTEFIYQLILINTLLYGFHYLIYR